MATVKKLIGRLPVYKGDWVAGTYSMLNQVSYLGSTFQSKIDNNTSQPATLVNNVLQVNSNWNVISNGTSAYLADSRLTSVEGKTTVLEQNVSLFNRKPQGLKFKSGGNTVFAKTMKALVLGTDDFTIHVVARSEGSTGFQTPVLGYSMSSDSMSCIKVYAVESRNGHNGITDVFFEGASNRYININKTDTTKNLHSIVITRYSETVTVIVNGRLVKSSIQNSIFSINNFIYDIANTSYFWGGAVFNYAMTQTESNKLLWNGGRYDEVRLGSEWRQPIVDLSKSTFNKVDGMKVAINCNCDNISKPADAVYFTLGISGGGYLYIVSPISEFTGIKKGIVTAVGDRANAELFVAFYDANKNKVGEFTSINNNNIIGYIVSVLLEYRPENIRADRYLNSGVMGSDYDLIYSTVKPEIIYDKPYQDVVMLDENKAPDWHPIAIGQEVETPTNIFKAKLPDVGTEWKVSDWKQINN